MSPSGWAPDGHAILTVVRPEPEGFLQIGILPLVGERTYRLFERRGIGTSQGQVSRDGRWMAYTSVETGRFEVYVQSFPAGGGKRQISKNGGGHLTWSRDGRELYYYALDGHFMAVPVHSGPELDIGAAVPLFEPHLLTGPVPALGHAHQWDVSADGRFLMNVPVEDTSASAITVVVNWPAMLKK